MDVIGDGCMGSGGENDEGGGTSISGGGWNGSGGGNENGGSGNGGNWGVAPPAVPPAATWTPPPWKGRARAKRATPVKIEHLRSPARVEARATPAA